VIPAPGWTSYHHRLRYQTYDVTPLLREGENKLEVLLGNGWFRGHLAGGGRRALYGDRLALLAQLEVTYAVWPGLIDPSGRSPASRRPPPATGRSSCARYPTRR
jgi:hypothetical protein